MSFHLSVEAEAVLDVLETTGDDAFTIVVGDLALIDAIGLEACEVLAVLGSLTYVEGPTGRVRYWVGHLGVDEWLIEAFDVT